MVSVTDLGSECLVSQTWDLKGKCHRFEISVFSVRLGISKCNITALESEF